MNENYVRIGGGLTKDPHYGTTKYGGQLVGLTVAVNGARYDGQSKQQVVTTEYVSVIAFGTVADSIAEAGLARGDSVVVEGQISQQELVGDDGQKDRKTRVQAWRVHPVSVRSGGQQVQRQAPPQEKQNPWEQGQKPAGDPWGPPLDEPPF